MKAARIHSFGRSARVKIEDIPIPNSAGAWPSYGCAPPASTRWTGWRSGTSSTTRGARTAFRLRSGRISRASSRRSRPEPARRFGAGTRCSAPPGALSQSMSSLRSRTWCGSPGGSLFVEAAAIPLTALTAWQVVIDTARASPAKVFLIHGASGGVGAFAAQFALWKGARVVATASRPSFPFLERIGVHVLIDYKKERFEKKVTGVDVVIDPIGGATQARSWKCLMKGGMLINLIGEIDRAAARKAGVRAVDFGFHYDTRDLKQIAALLGGASCGPTSRRSCRSPQVETALDMNEDGRSHGKIVLKVA